MWTGILIIVGTYGLVAGLKILVKNLSELQDLRYVELGIKQVAKLVNDMSPEDACRKEADEILNQARSNWLRAKILLKPITAEAYQAKELRDIKKCGKKLLALASEQTHAARKVAEYTRA